MNIEENKQKRHEDLRDKKMSLNEWCEIAGFQKVNKESFYRLFNGVYPQIDVNSYRKVFNIEYEDEKKIGKDGIKYIDDNIMNMNIEKAAKEMNKDISIDEFYEATINGGFRRKFSTIETKDRRIYEGVLS